MPTPPRRFTTSRAQPPTRDRSLRRLLALAAASFLAVTAVDAAPAPSGSPREHQCRPGPWGDVRYTRIVIEPPDEFLAPDYSTPSPVRWVFPGFSRAELVDLWQRAGLSEAQQQELARSTVGHEPAPGCTVTPGPDFVLGLSTPARGTIYSTLARFAENPAQQEPFRFRADSAGEWFERCGLTPATISLVQRLLYQRGHSLLFSDHDVVLPLVSPRSERLRLVKTLARKSTLLVELRITPGSDVDALAAYWGHGPRRKDVRSLLQSLAHRPEGASIDISHLLPRFARSHLYTYPDASDHAGDANYDCHWTSLNFFHDPPQQRFSETAVVEQTLEQEYAPVEGPLLLGDVLVFVRPDGKAIHSCVYVADEIVFTKNGSSQVMPWILMSLPDVIAFYPSDPPLRVVAYRQRQL